MADLNVNSIGDASGGSTTSINGFTPTVSNMAGRNRIINGDMRIDQRNAGAAVTIVNDTNQYTADRWQVIESSSCVLSAQQVTDAPASFQNSLRLTVTTAAGSVGASEVGIVEQRLEGFNTADFAFGTASASSVTLSFWVKSSITGSFSGSLRNGSSDRAYPFSYTITAADTWEQKSVTIAGDTTGTWVTNNGIGIRLAFDIGSGSNRRGTAGAWAASNLDGVTGAASIVTTLNATWQVTGVQLEAGSVATPFEHRLYGQELQLCKRYYSNLYANSGTAIYFLYVGAYTSGTNVCRGVVDLSPPMRAAPSFSYTGTVQSNPGLGTVSLSLPTATIDKARIDVAHTTAATAAGSYGLFAANVVLSFSAEL